jgi:hypothetical protein
MLRLDKVFRKIAGLDDYLEQSDYYIREQDSGMTNPKICVTSVNKKVEGYYIKSPDQAGAS